uniref:LGFP repeat-containing protein n=1 Tax=Trichocoleus desertorum TaxID=1481672 RepID=UPI0025B5E442|nr:hypothetical protein [Trichocoleus desertorum]
MQSIEFTKVSPEAMGVARTIRPDFNFSLLIPTVDEESPIGRKWKAAGGAGTLGNPTSTPQPTPDGKGTYQEFKQAVIFYSAAYGARILSRALYNKWVALAGNGVQSYIGYPTHDYFGTRDGGQAIYFERGMIVVRGSGQAFVVYGMIYGHYREFDDVKGFLGLPLSDEEEAPNGGRRSRFDGGDLYWRGDTGARAIYGAIRDRWLLLGGAGGFLGYPLTDEMAVMKGSTQVGRFNRFQGGTIYWSGGTGAWEVYGAIRDAWENQYGGATGALGFPTSGETSTPTSGGRFNNFEKGVLVWHGGGAYAGTRAIFSLEFYMDRFGSKGDDGLGGAQDVYVYVDVSASTGQRFNTRMPSRDDYGADEEIDRVFIRVPVVRGDLVVNVRLDGWDSDSGRPFDGDDRLGTVQERYTIDNLWGLSEDATHWRGNFLAVYKFRDPMPYDPTKFRQQLFWPFANFSTAELSRSQYAQTFRDVAEDESWFWHPFNRAFYELVYKKLAAGGNCFGMCLESVYAQVNRSIYAEPISRFGPQDGSKPNPNKPSDREIINEINLKHGYQVSGGLLNWFLGKFIAGHTHDPVRAFRESRDAHYRGDYPVMVVTPESLKVGGHVVRPYDWDDRNPNRWVIKIADPNRPAARYGDDDPHCRIEINPTNNTFRYQFSSSKIWSGGAWSGGRMYAIPFNQLCHHPRTPFWEVFALLTASTLILLGDDGETQQITDQVGRTFYEPNLGASPTQWQQIRQDQNARIPDLARVPLLRTMGIDPAIFDAVNLTFQQLPELYYKRGDADTIRQEISGRQGGQYRWAMRSAVMSATALVPNTSSATDVITVERMGSSDPTISLSTTTASVAKQANLELVGWAEGDVARIKRFELNNLTMAPGQSIKARLADGGQELLLENAGPETRFELKVRSGSNQEAATVRPNITLEAGKAARLRPADWAKDAIATAPVRMDLLDNLQGPVIRRIDL